MMQRPCVYSRRRVHTMIAAAAILLGGVFALSSGCVSSGKYRSLEQERDALAGRNQALQGEVNTANQKGDALTQEKTALASEKEALEHRLAQLQEQEKTLGSQLQQHEEEARQLKTTYDGLLGSLKKELENGQIQVQQLRDGLSVNVAQDILFASGSAVLDKNGSEVLRRVADQLKETKFQVVGTGHTDNKPIGPGIVNRYPTNRELAGGRAPRGVRPFVHFRPPAPPPPPPPLGATPPGAPHHTP